MERFAREALVLFGILSLPLDASVLVNQRTGLEQKVFSIKQACEKAGLKENLLTGAKDITKMDCMGRELVVLDFCKTLKLPGLVRGFVLEDERVVCESAKTVHVKIDCKDKTSFCKDKVQACKRLKKSFAHSLDLLHSGLTGPSLLEASELSCFFTSKIEEDISKIDPMLKISN